MIKHVATGDDLAALIGEAEPHDAFELEAGTHVLRAPIVVTVPVNLRGEGGGAVLRGAPDGPLLVIMAEDGDVFFDNLAFVRDEDGPPNDVVHVAAGEVTFMGCRFAGGQRHGMEGGHGCSVVGWSRVRLTACVAEDCVEAGLAAAGDAHIEASGCVFRRNGVGARFGDRSAGTVRDCTAERNARFGFMIADQAKPTLVANMIRENGAPGVAVMDDARPLVVDNRLDAADMADPTPPVDEALKDPETLLKFVGVAPLTLELGLDLVPLADPGVGGDLMDRMVPLRVRVAEELGFITPGIQFKDNLDLRANAYRVLVKGTPIAEGELLVGYHLAALTPFTDASEAFEGDVFPGTDPLTGADAHWIRPKAAERAAAAGWRVLDHQAVLLAHLEALVRAHAHEILSREEVALMLEHQRERTPKTVAALVPERMGLGEVHQVLARLLREGVSLKDFGTVLETLADAAYTLQEPELLAEAVRKRLARRICQGLADETGEVTVGFFEPDSERVLAEALEIGPDTPAAEVFRKHGTVIGAAIALCDTFAPGYRPVLVVSPALRPRLAAFLASRMPHVPVLAVDELHPAFRFVEARTRK